MSNDKANAGWPGHLTEKEENILKQFREKLKDSSLQQAKLEDDHYLTRWLRARNYNLKDAEEMLRNHLEFRRQYKADTILTDYEVPEVVKKYYTGGFAGVDKQGCPVFWDPFGHIDFKGLLKSITKRDVLKMKLQVLERLMADLEGKYAQMAGERVHQIVVVMDLQHFGLRHLWKPGIDVLLHVLKMFEANYPELLKCTVVINAPKIFPLAYKLVRPVLSEATAKKIVVHTSHFRAALLQLMEEDQIPAHYGGRLVDGQGDGKCQEWVCFGGEVPTSYHHGDTSVLQATTTQEVTISARKSFKLLYDVQKPGSIIRYEFCTLNHDINFGVLRRLPGDLGGGRKRKLAVVMKPVRVNSHMVPEDGTLDCPLPGVYVVQFDNKYSWMRSKKVTYSIEVIEPLEVGQHDADEMGGAKEAMANEIEGLDDNDKDDS